MVQLFVQARLRAEPGNVKIVKAVKILGGSPMAFMRLTSSW